jgi:hypothetical protein
MMLNSFLHVIIIISSLNDATGSSVSFRKASKPNIKRRQQASINQVEYKVIMNALFQTKDRIRGIQNVDFVKVAGLSLSECMSQRNDSSIVKDSSRK